MLLRALYQTSPATLTSGQYGALQLDSSQNLKVAVQGTVTTSLSSTTVTSLPQGSAIYNGKKTVTTATTREALASTQTVKGVVIKALAANTGVVYVGNSSVAAANGFALAAGEAVTLDIDDLATVYLDVSVSGEGVTYIATN